MKNYKVFTIFFFIILSIFSILIFSKKYHFSHKIYKKEEKIDYIVKKLEKTHPNPFFKISKKQFHYNIETLKKDIPLLKEEEIDFRLMKIIAEIEDAHTALIPNANSSVIPIEMYLFGKELIITKAIEKYKYLIGMKILSINKISIDQIIKTLESYISHENKYWLLETIPKYLRIKEILKNISSSINNDFISFELEKDGKIISINFPFYSSKDITKEREISLYEYYSLKDPLTFKYKKTKNYFYKYFSTEKILFIQYNSCNEMSSQRFKSFANDIKILLKNQYIKSAIIDLRFNNGGNSLLFTKELLPLVKELNEQGKKLFVLIGRSTFSSAVIAVGELLKNAHPILIGEPCGNKPTHYGQTKRFILLDSKFNFSCSSKLIKIDELNKDTFFPDYYIQNLKEDIFSGSDRVFNFAFMLAKQ